MTFRVRIERLILDGLPIGRADAQAVRLAVEAELARLIDAHGLTDTGARTVPGAAAPAIRIAASAGPRAIGEQVARSLFATVSTVSTAPPSPASRSGHDFSLPRSHAGMTRMRGRT
jgi:hypothetical protein